MDNTIDMDHMVGLAFKLAHRMRAAQVAAGWDPWDLCLKPNKNMQKTLQKRVSLFVEFLSTPDERGLSSYVLRCDALETSLISMEGIITRNRIAFQEQQSGNMSEREQVFAEKTKEYMTGKQVCDDARILLEQMIDVQTQMMNSMDAPSARAKSGVK